MRCIDWMGRAAVGIAVVSMVGLSTGCEPERADETRNDARPEVPEELREGLSPEEIRRRAEPIPQEEAQRRGMIDTTIYIEDLDVDEAGESRDPPPDPTD